MLSVIAKYLNLFLKVILFKQADSALNIPLVWYDNIIAFDNIDLHDYYA